MALEVQPRRFTITEFVHMFEHGILDEERDRVELIEGEILEMSPTGTPHSRAMGLVNRKLVEFFAAPAMVLPASSLPLDEFSLPQPDFVVYVDIFPGDDHYSPIPPKLILLVVEVAASSLRFDRGRKAALYARRGIREYWVLDVRAGLTYVYSGPREDGTWASCDSAACGEFVPSKILAADQLPVDAILEPPKPE